MSKDSVAMHVNTVICCLICFEIQLIQRYANHKMEKYNALSVPNHNQTRTHSI